jgi:chromosome segregation ATPase
MIKESIDKIMAKQESFNDIERESAELKSKYVELESAYQHNLKILSAKQQEEKELEKQYEFYYNSHQQKNIEIENQKNEISSLLAEIGKFKHKFDFIIEENKDLKIELKRVAEEMFQHKDEAIAKQVKKSTQQRKEFEMDIKDLRSGLDEQKDIIFSLIQTKKYLEQEQKTLKFTRDDQQKAIKNLSKNNLILKDIILKNNERAKIESINIEKTLTNELELARNEIHSLKQSRSNLELEKIESAKEFEKLSSEFNSWQIINQKQDTKINELNNELAEKNQNEIILINENKLNTQLMINEIKNTYILEKHHLQTELSENYMTEINQLKIKHSQKSNLDQTEINHLNSKITTLETSHEKTIEKLKKYTSKSKIKAKEIDDLNLEVENLKQENSEYMQVISDMKTSMEECLKIDGVHKSEINTLKSNISTLQNLLQKSEDESKSKTNNIDKLKLNHESEITMLKADHQRDKVGGEKNEERTEYLEIKLKAMISELRNLEIENRKLLDISNQLKSRKKETVDGYTQSILWLISE